MAVFALGEVRCSCIQTVPAYLCSLPCWHRLETALQTFQLSSIILPGCACPYLLHAVPVATCGTKAVFGPVVSFDLTSPPSCTSNRPCIFNSSYPVVFTYGTANVSPPEYSDLAVRVRAPCWAVCGRGTLPMPCAQLLRPASRGPRR